MHLGFGESSTDPYATVTANLTVVGRIDIFFWAAAAVEQLSDCEFGLGKHLYSRRLSCWVNPPSVLSELVRSVFFLVLTFQQLLEIGLVSHRLGTDCGGATTVVDARQWEVETALTAVEWRMGPEQHICDWRIGYVFDPVLLLLPCPWRDSFVASSSSLICTSDGLCWLWSAWSAGVHFRVCV